MISAAGSTGAWFPGGSGAEFEFPDGVKVTTRNGSVPINNRVLELYDDYLTDWRIPTLDGVPFTDRRIMGVLKKRPSLQLHNWKVNFAAILSDEDDGVECDAYVVSTNDEEEKLVGIGASIGDKITDDFILAWLATAEENNWAPQRPGLSKRKVEDFLVGNTGLSVNKEIFASKKEGTALTDEDIMAWFDSDHQFNVNSEVQGIVANNSIAEILSALRMYYRLIIQRTDIHEDAERDNCSWLVEPNGPFRTILPEAYEYENGDTTNLDEIDSGDTYATIDGLFGYLMQADSAEGYQEAAVWYWLQAISNPNAGLEGFKTAPSNLHRDFRALVQEHAERVFSELIEPDDNSM